MLLHVPGNQWPPKVLLLKKISGKKRRGQKFPLFPTTGEKLTLSCEHANVQSGFYKAKKNGEHLENFQFSFSCPM